MKKRKFLLTALCLSSVTACALGLAACGDDKPTHSEHSYSAEWTKNADGHYHACTGDGCTEKSDEAAHTYGDWQVVTAPTTESKGQDKRSCTVCEYDDFRETDKLTEQPPAEHAHAWGAWTVTDENKPTATATGKATRTCAGEGDCNGTAADKEYVLPALTSEDYTKTTDTATCSKAGEITYTYKKDGVEVSFKVATPVNAEAHDYGDYTYADGTGHYKVCSLNGEHKTATEAHDQDGTDGACSKCGYTATTPEPEPDGTLQGPEDSIAVQVGGGKSAVVNAYSLASGYYTFTYEGNTPITISYEYSVLGTGTVSDTVTLSASGETSFVANLSSRATCRMVISSASATEFSATVTMDFSLTDPNPVSNTLELNTEKEITVNYFGTAYVFTAQEAGEYVLTCTGDAVDVLVGEVDEEEFVEAPYTFELEAGESIRFLLCAVDYGVDATFSARVSVAEEEPPVPPAPVHNHVWGAWTVTPENMPTETAGGKATRTCTGAGDCDATAIDKEYSLPALTSDDYSKEETDPTVNEKGSVVYTYEKDGVNVSFTVYSPMLESQEYEITVAGRVPDVTVKIGDYTGTTDSNGVAKIKAEKQTYPVVIEYERYSFTAGEVSVENSSLSVTLPAALTGGTAPDHIGENGVITAAGIYTTTIGAKADEEIAGKYTLVDRWFSFKCTNEAKTYTVKILSANTTATPDEAGYDSFTGVGESYTIVLEQGDKTVFGFTTNDENVPANYSYKVVFEITEADAPEAGVYERPIRLDKDVENTVAVSGENQKVYYRLSNEDYGKYAKITHGEGVTVYMLGFSKAGEATQLGSDGVIELSEYENIKYVYLYAVSTGGNITLSAQVHYLDGMKEKPFEITIGENNSPEFNIAKGIREQWYKAEVATGGTYIIKPDAVHANLEVYTDVNGEAVKTVSSGAAASVELAAGDIIYIKVSSSLNQTFNFTVAEFSDADKGLSAEDPYEILVGGEYTAFEGEHYYVFTPAVHSKIVFTYPTTVSGDYLFIYRYADSAYSEFVKNSGMNNTLEFCLAAGSTYYFKTSGEGLQHDKLTVAITELAAHDYVFTVTDGTNTLDNVTVTVLKNGEAVEGASGVTANGGKVTFNLLPDDFTLRITGLPENYGYYEKDVQIAINDDETTEFTVKVIEKQNFSATLKKPDGTPLAGVDVTFSVNNDAMKETFKVTTDADGKATIFAIPAIWKSVNRQTGKVTYPNTSYTITVELSDELKELYVLPSGTLSVTVSAPDKEIVLQAIVEYTITLKKDNGETWGEGVAVTVNGVTETTDANGSVTIKTIAGEYSITLVAEGKKLSTGVKTAKDAFTIEAVCYDVTNALTGSKNSTPKEVLVGESIISASTTASRAYFQFEAAEAGTYTFTISDLIAKDAYCNNVLLNGTDTTKRFIKTGTFDSTNTVLTTDHSFQYKTKTIGEVEYVYEFTITLKAEDKVLMSFKPNGYSTLNITKA